MSKRFPIQALLVTLIVGGVAVVADALVLTDAERLDAFVDDVSGEIETRRIDAALGYVDTSRVPVEVVMGSDGRLYEEGEEVDLADRARRTLAPFLGSDVRLIQKSIEHDEERAHVALRLGTREGIADVQFRLVKRGDGWLVTRVRVL